MYLKLHRMPKKELYKFHKVCAYLFFTILKNRITFKCFEHLNDYLNLRISACIEESTENVHNNVSFMFNIRSRQFLLLNFLIMHLNL